MADNLFIRKNSHGKSRLGLIPMLGITLGLGLFVFYVSIRYLSPTETGLKTSGSKKGQQVNLRPVTESVTNFRPIEIVDPVDPSLISSRQGSSRRVERRDVKPRQSVLDTSGLTLGDFSANETVEQRPLIEEDLSGFGTMLRQTGLRENSSVQIQQADDGSEYLRSRSGIFTAFAEPGTQLRGPERKDYIIGDDSLLYRVLPSGVNEKELKIISGVFTDDSGRFYRITRNGQLRLITPGGPGTFVGPDTINYRITQTGDLEELRKDGSTRVVNQVSGEGEFTGSDGQQYAVLNGVLFKPNSEPVSFGASIITGGGLFTDPSGKTKVLGEDGIIYERSSTGELVQANIQGTGSFIGPDGTVYNKDSSGNVTRVSKGFNNEPAVLDPSLRIPAQISGGGSMSNRPSGIVGVSRAGENLLVMNNNGDPEAKIDLKRILSGNNVHTEEVSRVDARAEKIGAKNTIGRLIPIGQNIPFYTLTDVSTQFEDGGGMVEAVVAENVYFQGAKIPAGSRLYGTYQGVGTHNRVRITFNTILLVTGEQIPVSGFVYDTKMQPGIEAYFEPTAPWVIATRYANAALLIKISENQPRDSQTNQPIGDNSYMVEAIQQTQEDLEERYGQYYVIPRGTAGVFKLNASIDLNDRLVGIQTVDTYNIKTQVTNELSDMGVSANRPLASPVGDARKEVGSTRNARLEQRAANAGASITGTYMPVNNPTPQSTAPVFIGPNTGLTGGAVTSPSSTQNMNTQRSGAGAAFLE